MRDLPINGDGTGAADPAPDIAADAVDSVLVPGVEQAHSLFADGASGSTGSTGTIADVIAGVSVSSQEQAGRAVPLTQGHRVGGTQSAGTSSADPLATASQTPDPQTASDPAGTLPSAPASTAQPVTANGSSALSVANQVAPALVAMAKGGGIGGRLSISITPEQLGQVHITVERSADGMTSIHVAAEQLGTLDMLRQDRADLTRVLDQANLGQGGHSLSFSWDGGGGGMPGWGTPGDQQGEQQMAQASGSYAVEATPTPAVATVSTRGGIDLTA